MAEIMARPQCLKCGGKGWLPFKRSDGTVVAGIRVDCECKEFDYEEARDTLPEDLDFPVSYDFYRWHQRSYLGLPDPMPVEVESEEPVRVEHYHHHYHMRGNFSELNNQVQELRGFMKHHVLKEKERIGSKRPKSKYS